jgi:predicted flap endonuclease-1-like 5' DNA nuclease
MIATNLDHIPGRKLDRIIGIVFGYAPGKTEDEGELRELFEIAESDLLKDGERKGASAVLGVKADICRDREGRPGIFLIGTAVALDNEEEEGGMAVSMNGQESHWTIPPANPSDEVVRLIKQRDRSDRQKEKEKLDIYDLADEIGISYDRAKLLMDNGYKDLRDIADASSRDLADIEGLNPTQARILRSKAREILDRERGL